MAGKATRMPNASEFQQEGATADAAELEKLAKAAADKNKKEEKKAEAKKNGPSPEVIKMHWDETGALYSDVAVAKRAYDKLKNTLRSRYSEAKADGVDIEAFKRLRKMEELALDELDAEMLEVARIAGIVGSKIANTSFAQMLENADKVNPYTQGYTAGKAGDNFDTNPHTPGTEKFEKWSNGWNDGQAKLAQELFGKKEKEAGTTASEKKNGKGGGKPRASRKKKASAKNVH